MKTYKSLTRTTLHDMDALPYCGIYIIAYMGKILYVGKAVDGVFARLSSHLYRRDVEDIGGWMYKVRDDWHNVRLDVLEAPDTGNVDVWLRESEASLIRLFRPMFNTHLV